MKASWERWSPLEHRGPMAFCCSSEFPCQGRSERLATCLVGSLMDGSLPGRRGDATGMTVFWRSGVEDVLCRSDQQPHNPVLEGAPVPTRTLQAAHGGWKARLYAIVDGQRTEMRPVSAGLTSGLKGPRMRVRQLAMLVYPYFGTDAERARVRPHFIRRETRLWTGSWAWLLEAWNAHPGAADVQLGEPGGDCTQAALRGVCATTWPTYSTE